jgi:hypothetical protein
VYIFISIRVIIPWHFTKSQAFGEQTQHDKGMNALVIVGRIVNREVSKGGSESEHASISEALPSIQVVGDLG